MSMKKGKVRCEKCRGRGGWHVIRGFIGVFQACLECRGKGSWWPNNRPKVKVKR